MCTFFRFSLLGFGALGLLSWVNTCPAGWICIKNETTYPIVIQEILTEPNGKRGRILKLHPGEKYREYQDKAGERKVQIFDAVRPLKPLWIGKLRWFANETQQLPFQSLEFVIRERSAKLPNESPSELVQVITKDTSR